LRKKELEFERYKAERKNSDRIQRQAEESKVKFLQSQVHEQVNTIAKLDTELRLERVKSVIHKECPGKLNSMTKQYQESQNELGRERERADGYQRRVNELFQQKTKDLSQAGSDLHLLEMSSVSKEAFDQVVKERDDLRLKNTMMVSSELYDEVVRQRDTLATDKGKMVAPEAHDGLLNTVTNLRLDMAQMIPLVDSNKIVDEAKAAGESEKDKMIGQEVYDQEKMNWQMEKSTMISKEDHEKEKSAWENEKVCHDQPRCLSEGEAGMVGGEEQDDPS
jgi:hypothetical protein